MQKKNLINKTVAATLLISLMISAAFSVFTSTNATTVPAQITSVPSNMLQYEWPTAAANASRSFFSAGPAPNAPNIAWKVKIPGVMIGISGMTAFNGLVFAVSESGTVYALDGGTGSIVWQRPGAPTSFGATIVKIDNNYMMINNVCVKIVDGSTVWTGPPGFSVVANAIEGAGYVPELKMFVDGTYGWNLPDPSQPPTLAWNLTSQQNVGNVGGGGFSTGVVYGDGKVFVGSPDAYWRAYDAKTGTLIWEAPVTSILLYGASYGDGRLYHGGLDNNMKAWDANTGNLLWTYNPGTWYGQWASSTAYAYGMVYEHNQDNYIYAINATTGKLVWRQQGPGVGYSDDLVVADGKVYCQMGENEYRDFNTGEYGYSEFACFDAYTGKLLWTLPLENGSPFNAECIAYGNLYLIPTISSGKPGVWKYVLNSGTLVGEVWCISSQTKDWPMFLGNPEHSAEGAGPTNLVLKWKFKAGNAIVSSPTLVNGVCYFGSMDKYIYAIDADTGTKKWTFKTGYEVQSSVAVVDGKVFTGADDGSVYCLNATTGSQLWKTPAGGVTTNLLGIGQEPPVRSSPIVLNGKVYVGSLDGNLYCLDANSGSVVWKFKGVEPCVILATPAISDNAIYLASTRGGYPVGTGPAVTNGDFYKLDLNGNVIWHKEIPYVLNRTLGSGNFLFASPTVAEGMVFVRNGFYENFALNATTGETIWTYKAMTNEATPFQSGGVIQMGAPLYAYGTIYINDYYAISALNSTDGTRIWTTYLSREDLSQGISYAYGRIYVVTEVGVLYVLKAQTGEKLSYYEFGTVQLHSMPSLYKGFVYVGCNDWNLYCFGEARLMSTAGAASQASSSSASSVQEQPSAATSTPASTTIAVAVIGVAAIAVVAILLKKRK